MSPNVDATTVCVEECGSACCSGGAFLRPSDADTLAEAGHADAIAENAPHTRTDEDGTCTLLGDDNRCTVYEDRPLDCRLFPIGYDLDDDTRTVHIVLVGCPLAEQYSQEGRHRLAQRGRTLLEEFDAEALRRYDELPFTGPYSQLTTVPFDSLPHNL